MFRFINPHLSRLHAPGRNRDALDKFPRSVMGALASAWLGS